MLRPCLDCGTPTEAGSRCAECAPAARVDRRRGRKRERRSSAWDRLSKRARRAQPWCSECGSTDDLTADHVVPLADGGPMLPGPAGVAVLCRSCNARKGSGGRPGDGPPSGGGAAPGGLVREPITLRRSVLSEAVGGERLEQDGGRDANLTGEDFHQRVRNVEESVGQVLPALREFLGGLDGRSSEQIGVGVRVSACAQSGETSHGGEGAPGVAGHGASV